MNFIIPGLTYQIFAIKIENSDYFGVSVNTIKGNVIANYCDVNTCGILIENCNEGGVICNEFGDPGIATQFTFNKNLLMEGIINRDFIGGNKFRYEHLWSLYIKNSPDGLGIQGDPYYVTDNEWYLSSGSPSCTFTTQDIVSENSHTSVSAITQFHVRSGAPYQHDLPIAITALPANPNVISASPMPDKLCTFLRISDGNLERSIADGSAFVNNNSEAYKWYSQNWLYRNIPNNSMYSTSLFNDFYNDLDNGNYGALKSIINQVSIINSTNSPVSTSNFIPTNNVEGYIKNILDISAQIHNQGISSISLIQKTLINNVSILCPQIEGPGVYMARAYRTLFDEHIYEYSSLCNDSSGYINRLNSNTKATKTPSAALFYYNNALHIESISNENYTIEIMDLSGKIVYSTNINSNNVVDLNLKAGMYIYVLKLKLKNKNELSSIGKLIVVQN